MNNMRTHRDTSLLSLGLSINHMLGVRSKDAEAAGQSHYGRSGRRTRTDSRLGCDSAMGPESVRNDYLVAVTLPTPLASPRS